MNDTTAEKIDQTSEERSFIDGFVASYCRPHAVVLKERLAAWIAVRRQAMLTAGCGSFALAAGVSAPKLENVQAPDEEVVFMFASEGAPDAPGAWKAQLRVPPKAGPETQVTLTVEGEGDGLFRLAGMTLPIVAGCAQLPFGQFLAGIKDAEVAFRRMGASESVKGTLAFFS